MSMRKIASCLVAGMLAISMDGMAQSTLTNNWTAVTTVPSGQSVVIELRTGKKVKGKFGSASETSVTLVHGTKTEDINRSDIRKVSRESGGSAGKSTLIGTAIGGGAGAGLGAAAGGCDQSCFIDRGELTAAFGVAGAGIGAVLGLVVGKARQKKTLIYEVR